MKTPRQIKNSLFRCSEGECDRCDYFDECYNEKGTIKQIALLLDTMDYLHQLEKERDAASTQEIDKVRSFMIEYPRQYGMDRIFVRVSRDGKYMNICFSDLTEDEQNAFLDTLTESGLKRMCLELAKSLRAFPEYAVKLEMEAKNHAMRMSLQDPIPAKPTAPFGYNDDGTPNEKEAEVVRFVFSKQNEYFFNPPQELIDEAYAWAKEEGMTLNDEEAADMARARIPAYIARQVQEEFPDVKYRKAAPVKGRYPSGLKYPSRPLKGEEIIDRDLFAQVREILAHG